MNIFFLDYDPKVAAKQHADKHVVKMVLESAQLLSTAHRLLDGTRAFPEHKAKVFVLPGEVARVRYDKIEIEHPLCYKATHVRHPCAIWVMKSPANYMWVYQLMIELDLERQHRFTPALGKTIRELGEFLSKPPTNSAHGLQTMTPPAQAMPDECKNTDPVKAYRAYYMQHKQHLAKWTKRQLPWWYIAENPSKPSSSL